MNLTCDLSLAANYKSQSQIARVRTEAWLASNGYCLACDCDELEQKRNNEKHLDFTCPKCLHRYELKSFKNREPKRINDGAYAPMIQDIHAGLAPSLFLLRRSADWQVQNLTVTHSSFLLPNAIVKRKPLSERAKRGGHIMCLIDLGRIHI